VLLGGDREDLGDRPGVLGMAQGGEPEERPDRCKAGVPGSRRVAAVLFQVGEEAADQPGVDGGDIEGSGCGACFLQCVAQEQPPGVTVGADGARAGLPLAVDAVAVG
jgi:hypothetical protein